MIDRIGVVVDGDGDFASLKQRFKDGYRILKTDGPRSHTVGVRDIAQKSRKQLRILRSFKCTRAIIVLDFEERTEDYEDFVRDLNEAFSLTDFEIPVFVAVANRMIENWYLADIEYLSKKRAFIRNTIKQKNYEGSHGKKELKKCMKPGISYHETKHGPELFKILRFEVAANNSKSFGEFLDLAKVNC